MTPHFLTRSLDRSASIFILVVAGLGVLIPLSNLLLPAGSFFQVPTYLVALWGKYVCYAIKAGPSRRSPWCWPTRNQPATPIVCPSATS